MSNIIKYREFFNNIHSIVSRECGEESTQPWSVVKTGMMNNVTLDISTDYRETYDVPARLSAEFHKKEVDSETLPNGMILVKYQWCMGGYFGREGEVINISFGSTPQSTSKARVCVNLYERIVRAAELIERLTQGRRSNGLYQYILQKPAPEVSENDRRANGSFAYKNKSDLIEMCEEMDAPKYGTIDDLKERIKETARELGGDPEKVKAFDAWVRNKSTGLDGDLYNAVREGLSLFIVEHHSTPEEAQAIEDLIEAGLVKRSEEHFELVESADEEANAA